MVFYLFIFQDGILEDKVRLVGESKLSCVRKREQRKEKVTRDLYEGDRTQILKIAGR